MRKQWVITGGASGIGARLVSEVVADGAHAIVWDVIAPRAAENVSDMHVDLLQAADIEASANRLSGGVRAFVHCAGMGVITSSAHADVAKQLRLAYELHVVAFVVGVQGLHDRLVEGRGAVIAVSSAAMDVVYVGTLAYGASKAALIDQLGPKDVRINGVAPGAIDTPMTRQSWSDERLAAQCCAFIPLGRQAQSWSVTSLIRFPRFRRRRLHHRRADYRRSRCSPRHIQLGGLCIRRFGARSGMMGFSLIQQRQLRAIAGVYGCSGPTHLTRRPTCTIVSLSMHRTTELGVEAELIVRQGRTGPTVGSDTI